MVLYHPRRSPWSAAIIPIALCAVSFFTTAKVTAGDETEPRLDLIRADGTTEPLVIARVVEPRSAQWGFDLRRGSKSFAATSGTEVFFVTDDPRAAFDQIVVTVPSPVPAVLAARVPVADHPKLRDVTLVIRDEKTARPLTDAGFEAAEANAPILSQHADEKGQVILHEVNGRSGFVRWHRLGFWIHAPAHVGSDGTRWRYLRGSAPWSTPEASEVDDVLAGRPIPVRLTPLEVEAQVETRSVRILGADGAPVAGAFVWIPRPLTLTGRALGVVFGRRGEFCDGFRRTGADGTVSIPIFPTSRLPVAGIEVRLPTADAEIGGVPFLAYGLAYDALPKDEVREIHLRAVATVELTIEGLPPDSTIEIGADAHPRARTPFDGPVAPTIYDRGVQEALADFDNGPEGDPALHLPRKGAVLAACEFDLQGSFRNGGPPYRRPVPVGRRTTLWMDRPIGPRDPDGDVPVERRRLDVTPDKPGPLKIRKRWEELPLAK